MDIKEIRAAKEQCENQIREILSAFQQQTGCSVNGVEMHAEQIIGEPPHIVYVEIDVRV